MALLRISYTRPDFCRWSNQPVGHGLTLMANQSLAESEFARRHFKRNFFFGVSNGVLFNFAWAFIGTSTILPLFISRLTSSQLLIGLASTLESLGWFLPQVAIAAITLHRTHQKPVYMKAAVFRAISFVLFATLVLVLGSEHPNHLLWIFFLLFSVYSFGGGLGGVSFMDMVGKSIPPEKRGSFFGMRMLIGGGLSALAGLLIERILNAYDFPHNFGVLFLIASVLIILALACVTMMKEPVAPVKPPRKTVRENLLWGFSIARADRSFRMLLWVRVAIGCYVMGLPFYIIYASKFLHVPSSMAGLFLSVQMVGFLSSNLLWAYLSNRRKNRLVLVYCAFFSAACPALVLLSVFVGIPLWLYGAVFFFLGATISGLDMGYLNYLLEIAPEEKRPIYLGFLNTVVSPTIFLSAIGGLIIQVSSFAFLYTLLFGLSLAAVLLSLSLKNMRESVPAE
jgi:MFS family permease